MYDKYFFRSARKSIFWRRTKPDSCELETRDRPLIPTETLFAMCAHFYREALPELTFRSNDEIEHDRAQRDSVNELLRAGRDRKRLE